MRVHEDRFKPGDLATWRNDDMKSRWPSSYSSGDRMTIKDVIDVPFYSIRGTGHTQLVSIMEDPEAREFSAAYIRHLATWER